MEKITGHINSDNWRRYLANTSRVDATAIFACLAKAEGRKRKGSNNNDMFPTISSLGEKVINPRGKAELIAEAFKRKCAASARRDNEHPQSPSGSHGPLLPFRGITKTSLDPARGIELLRAIKEQASNKAPYLTEW